MPLRDGEGVCLLYEVEDGRNLESIKGGLSLWKSLDAEVAHAELSLVDKIIISSWQDFHLEGGLKLIRIVYSILVGNVIIWWGAL